MLFLKYFDFLICINCFFFYLHLDVWGNKHWFSFFANLRDLNNELMTYNSRDVGQDQHWNCFPSSFFCKLQNKTSQHTHTLACNPTDIFFSGKTWAQCPMKNSHPLLAGSPWWWKLRTTLKRVWGSRRFLFSFWRQFHVPFTHFTKLYVGNQTSVTFAFLVENNQIIHWLTFFNCCIHSEAPT